MLTLNPEQIEHWLLQLFWPFARELFRFGPLHADDVALTLGTGALALVALELLKPLSRPRAAG